MTTELKKLRIDRNISQQELADIIGVSVRSISRYENGTCIPPVDAAIRIAAYYDMLVEEIFHMS